MLCSHLQGVGRRFEPVRTHQHFSSEKGVCITTDPFLIFDSEVHRKCKAMLMAVSLIGSATGLAARLFALGHKD